jgi:hypothetical protein
MYSSRTPSIGILTPIDTGLIATTIIVAELFRKAIQFVQLFTKTLTLVTGYFPPVIHRKTEVVNVFFFTGFSERH